MSACLYNASPSCRTFRPCRNSSPCAFALAFALVFQTCVRHFPSSPSCMKQANTAWGILIFYSFPLFFYRFLTCVLELLSRHWAVFTDRSSTVFQSKVATLSICACTAPSIDWSIAMLTCQTFSLHSLFNRFYWFLRMSRLWRDLSPFTISSLIFQAVQAQSESSACLAR